MTKYISHVVAFTIAVLALVCNTVAQDDKAAATAAATDRLVISAEAGGVNYVEGTVGIVRKAGKSGLLLRRDEVKVGDRVSTGADGRAEILLNPGSFLRLGPNSAFEFASTGLSDLKLGLDSGSAIFEVYAAGEFKVTVVTPGGKVSLIQSGVFRIDADPKLTTVSVWEGAAMLDDQMATVVPAGREATLSKKVVTVAKFDRGNKDEFEAWSRSRSKLLAKTTASLKNRAMRAAMMNALGGGQYGFYNSFGLWVLDPFSGMFCFLPFGNGWRSPYGFGYNNCSCNYGWPYGWNQPTWGGNSGGSGSSGGNGGGTGGGSAAPSTPLVMQGDRSAVPPFIRLEQIGGGGVRGITDSGSGGSGNSGGSSPSYSPPPTYTPPPPPPPPPASSDTKGNTKDG